MMTVRALKDFTGSKGKIFAGRVFVVSDSVGNKLIAQGLAEKATSGRQKTLQDKMNRPQEQPTVETNPVQEQKPKEQE